MPTTPTITQNPTTTWQIYLGLHIPGSAEVVSDKVFAGFLAATVVPHFESFTVTDGLGYWRGRAEPVKVLTIITTDGHRIKHVAESYKAQYDQEAVLVNALPSFPTLL